MNLLQDLKNKGLIDPPQFVIDNLILLSISGSQAYGISTDMSDTDLVGICIPDKKYVYNSYIHGYEEPKMPEGFSNHEWQKHHIKDGSREYDIKIFSITKFFKLAEAGNPNILDFILSPDECTLHITEEGRTIRDISEQFCSKQSLPKYFGFAYNHFRDMQKKRNGAMLIAEKRKVLFDKFGYDTKDAGHCLRAIYCLRDMLRFDKYNVNTRCEYIKEVRNGLLTYEEAEELIRYLEADTKKLAENSTLRDEPNHYIIRSVLKSILEEYYAV